MHPGVVSNNADKNVQGEGPFLQVEILFSVVSVIEKRAFKCHYIIMFLR